MAIQIPHIHWRWIVTTQNCPLANDPLVQRMALEALKPLTRGVVAGHIVEHWSHTSLRLAAGPIVAEKRGTLDPDTERDYLEAIGSVIEQEHLPEISDGELHSIRAEVIRCWTAFPKNKQSEGHWRDLVRDAVEKHLYRPGQETSEMLFRWYELSVLRYTSVKATERRRVLNATARHAHATAAPPRMQRPTPRPEESSEDLPPYC